MTITLYALSTCIHCKNTKKFLDEHDIAYDCVFVDRLSGEERNETIRKVKEYNKSCSFPTTVIDEGDKVIVGYRQDELKEALGI